MQLIDERNRPFDSALRRVTTIDEPPFEDIGIELPYIWQGSAAWGDYDGDDDLDIVMTSGYEFSEIFRNDGNNIFTDVDAGLETVNGGNASWGDYDRDGDLDLLLVGSTDFNIPIARIYRNDGNAMFTETHAQLIGVWSSSVTEWGDYDNDGDLDFLLSGYSRSNDPVTRIYRNEGNDVFANDQATILEGVIMNSMAWGDYDNDDDLDMLWTGWKDGEGTVSKIYQNNDGAFNDILAPLENINQSSVAWGDYDNDGDLDILLAGWSDELYEVTRIYRNDEDTFTDIHAPLINVAREPSTAWGDYDNDGDLDVLIRGCIAWDNDFGGCPQGATAVFANDGASTFKEVVITLSHEWANPVRWGDYDNDGDLDILVTNNDATRIYRNNITTSNSIPSAPDSLRVSLLDGVQFEWDAANDSETPAQGLNYNIRVGTTPGGKEVVASMTGENGYRQLVELGNAGHGSSATLNHLPAGTYYWSVQAIDTAFAGSPFADEHSFTIWTVFMPMVVP